VLRGDGERLPLVLRLEEHRIDGVPALVCDKALIQASTAEDGSLSCKARYVVSRVHAEAIDVEFPAPLKECRPAIRLGGHTVVWELGAGGSVARVPLKAWQVGNPGIL